MWETHQTCCSESSAKYRPEYKTLLEKENCTNNKKSHPSILVLREAADGRVKPRTDPLVAELFVSCGVGQLASWNTEETQRLITGFLSRSEHKQADFCLRRRASVTVDEVLQAAEVGGVAGRVFGALGRRLALLSRKHREQLTEESQEDRWFTASDTASVTAPNTVRCDWNRNISFDVPLQSTVGEKLDGPGCG